MKQITAETLAAVVGGTLLAGDRNTPVSVLNTDTRNIAAGELFVPLKGQNFDGHAFIPTAMEKGACGCLCEAAPESFAEGRVYIQVRNARHAMKALAKWYRQKFSLPVVEITGSTGKTTAKEMLWSVLSQHGKTLKTEANFNSDIGTPLTLLQLDDSHEFAVIESGMDHAGEIRYLGEMVLPQIAVIMNVGEVHMEFLGSRENIMKAKCEIFENLQPGGVAVINGDDDMLPKADNLPEKVVRFGRGENCGVRAVSVKTHGLLGTDCTVVTGKDTYELHCSTPGDHMAYPISMCVAVGELLGLSKEEITAGVKAYEPVGGRLRIHRLPGNRILIDDCYNANPQSMGAALRVLAGAEGSKRIAVLGNMGELGPVREKAHRDMGALTGELGIDELFAIAPLAELMAEEAKKAGCPKVHAYLTKDEAYEEILKACCEGSVILLKASHYTGRFETITAYLEEKLAAE